MHQLENTRTIILPAVETQLIVDRRIEPAGGTWSRPAKPHIGVPYAPSLALQLLKTQPKHYAQLQVYAHKLIVQPGDTITVPKISNLNVGNIVRLDCVQEVGSRDYTIRGEPYLDHLVQVNGVVTEIAEGPPVVRRKFKKRKRYAKKIVNRPVYTRIRVGEFVWSQVEGQGEGNMERERMSIAQHQARPGMESSQSRP